MSRADRINGEMAQIHAEMNRFNAEMDRSIARMFRSSVRLPQTQTARSAERKAMLEEKLKASEEQLKREKAKVNFLKKEVTAMKWKMEKMEEGGEQEAPKQRLATPSCEICCEQYSSENPDKTPRILECGHTLCEECAGMMADGRELMCPFDRKTMKLKEAGVIALPRNYAIIQMIERK